MNINLGHGGDGKGIGIVMTLYDSTKMYHVEITPRVSEPPHKPREWEYDLHIDELERRFLTPYRTAKPMVINGRTIATDDLHRIRVYASERMIGHIPQKSFDMITNVTSRFIPGPPGYDVAENDTAKPESHPTTSMRVFISHSSHDVEIANLLIELLLKALHLRSDDIRCTSVDGYRMQAGVSIDEGLRAEVHDAELLIGLITPHAMTSAYVVFELGARWGANRPMIPLLASGGTPEQLGGPLAGINALDCSEAGQIYQFVEDSAGYLHVSLDKPSSYSAAVNQLAQMSQESSTTVQLRANLVEDLQLSEEAKDLLVEAVKDKRGKIVIVKAMGGMTISVNDKKFGEKGNRRSEAKWEQAVRDLFSQGLVNDPEGEEKVFEVTHEGFEVADALGISR